MVRSRKITHLVACIVTLLTMGVAVAQHATAKTPLLKANADDPITNFFNGISIIAWAFGLIPTIIAFSRGHTHKFALGFLNVIVCLMGIIPIFGWIVAPLGWIGTFIWAVSGEAKKEEGGFGSLLDPSTDRIRSVAKKCWDGIEPVVKNRAMTDFLKRPPPNQPPSA